VSAVRFDSLSKGNHRDYPGKFHGVTVSSYASSRSSTLTMHPWGLEFEAKIIRGEGLFRFAKEKKSSGYEPDLVIAHPGWGEVLFLQNVWPKAKLAIFCEWFYRANGLDVGFDPEFGPPSDDILCGITVKNLSYLSAMHWASGALSPTYWQASTFPAEFRKKIEVIHDGVDTQKICPSETGQSWPEFLIKAGIPINTSLVTFVNRNLEPYRGYHSFMRSLPRILAENSKIHVAMVGGVERGYGAAPPGGQTWRQVYEAEVFGQLTSQQQDRVHYLGRLPHSNLVRLYQISTVHVYLTYPFVLSWSLLEAMSAGCAVVASRTAPVEEVIRHDENGLLVDFFNPNELADKVLALLDNEKLRQLLGKQARQTVTDQYDLRTRCLPRQLDWVQSLL
jgi:glycosyltransferase involved in cell wall biosynthesis